MILSDMIIMKIIISIISTTEYAIKDIPVASIIAILPTDGFTIKKHPVITPIMASIIDNTFESSSNRSDNLILKMLTIINQIPTTTGINVDTKLGFIKTKIPSTTDITPEMILSKKISNPPNLKSSTNKKIPLIIRNVAIIYDITSRDISGFTTRSIPITRKNTDITIDAYNISFNFFFI